MQNNRFWPGFNDYAEGLVGAETAEDRIDRICNTSMTSSDGEPAVLSGGECSLGGPRLNGPVNCPE